MTVLKYFEKLKHLKKNYPRGIKLMKVIGLSILLLIALITLLRMGFLQQQILNSLSILINKHTDYQVNLDRIQFNIFNTLKMHNLTIINKTGIPLIEAEDLEVSFSWIDMFEDETITIAKIKLVKAHFYLQYNLEAMNLSEFLAQVEKMFQDTDSPELENQTFEIKEHASPSNLQSQSQMQFKIQDIDLSDTYFHYCDNSYIDAESNFSFNDLNVLIRKGQMKDFVIDLDSLRFDVLAIEGEETHRNFIIRDLKTKFFFSDQCLKFTDIDAKLNKHLLQADSISFRYDHVNQLTNFDSLDLAFNIRKSRLSVADLAWCFEPFTAYKDTLNLALVFSKQGQALHVQKVDLDFGANSHLQLAEFSTEDYNNWIIADYKLTDLDLTTDQKDLDPYLPTYLSQLLPLDYHISNFQATLNRQENALQAEGYLNSDLLKTSFQTQTFRKSFSVDLDLDFVDVDKLFKLNLPLKLYSSYLTFTGQDLGRQFKIDSLELLTESIHVFKQQFSNLSLKGTYQNNLLKLHYHLIDSNLDLTASNYIDFGLETLSGNMRINHLDLQGLDFVDQPLKVEAAELAILINSFDLKRSNGRLTIDDLTLSKPDKNQHIPYFYLDLVSNNQILYKEVYISSSILSAVFNLDVPDTSHLSYIFKFIENFKKNLLLEPNLNQHKYFGDYSYQSEVFAILHHINPLLVFFDLPFQLSKQTELNLQVNLNDLNYFKFELESDSLTVQDFVARDVLLDIDILETDNDNFDLSINLKSQQQNYKNLTNDELKLALSSAEQGYNFHLYNTNQHANEVDLAGHINLIDSTMIQVYFDTSSSVHILDTLWTINPDHKIIFVKDTILVDNLQLSLGEQLICLNANLKHQAADYLTLSIRQVKAKPLSRSLGKLVDGYLNFDFSLYDPYQDPKFLAQGSVDSLIFQDFFFDTLFVSTQQIHDQLKLEGYLKQNSKNVIVLNGLCTYEQDQPFVDLRLVLKGTPLKIIEPFVDKYISEIQGGIAGVVLIQGDLYNPQVNGDAYVVGGQFRINYLNTLYKLTDRFYFENDKLILKNIHLSDENKHEANLNGTITHTDFSKLSYDLDIQMDEFMVIDIPESNTALYYGLATLTGNMKVKTNRQNIANLSINAYTSKNTQIFFPFSSSSLSQTNALEQSYITFLKDTIKSSSLPPEAKKEKQIFTLSIDLEVTPDANVQMIFNQKKGDIIRGQGRGNLLMNYDQDGVFTIFGDVNVIKGDYHFTLLNLVDKEFILESGSRLVWAGDPYNAQLDIRASYNQKATFLPLLREYERTDLIELPESKVQYPVKVLLLLKGNISKPDIQFQIEFENYPLVFQEVLESFKHKLNFDSQERSKQVFSLIALKQFAQQSKFSVTESAGRMVTEFFSNQFSYWVSQIDPNLEISIDIENIEQDAINNLQLSISYSFLNGRAKIRHDNVQNFNQGNSNNIDQTTQSGIGDWTLEYSLLNKSNLKFKVYHRKNNTTSNNNLSGSNSQNGLSILHTGSSHTLKDIFRRKRKKYQ